MKTTPSVFGQNGRTFDWWANFKKSITEQGTTYEKYIKIRNDHLTSYHAVYSNYDLIFESEEYIILFLLKFS